MSVNIPIVESVVGGLVALSAFYCAFSCCCLLRYICRNNSANATQSEETTGPPNPDQELCRNDTLRRNIIDQFIKSTSRGKKPSYLKENNLKPKKIAPCPICFEEYCDNPSDILIGLLKKCGHYYHFDCVWKWLEQKRTCPLCRNDVSLTEEDIRGISLEHILSSGHQVSLSIENEKKEGTGEVNMAFDHELDSYSTDSIPDVVHYNASSGSLSQLGHHSADDRQRQRADGVAFQVTSVTGIQACRVCGSTFQGDPSGIVVGFLSDCGHYFHFDCIHSFVTAHRKCPTCDMTVHSDIPIFFALLKDMTRSPDVAGQQPDATVTATDTPARPTGHDCDISTHL